MKNIDSMRIGAPHASFRKRHPSTFSGQSYHGLRSADKSWLPWRHVYIDDLEGLDLNSGSEVDVPAVDGDFGLVDRMARRHFCRGRSKCSILRYH